MLKKSISKLLQVFKQEKGQGMVEYALLIGLIAVVVIAVLVLLGPQIARMFQKIVDELGKIITT